MELDEKLCQAAERHHGMLRVVEARALGLSWEGQRSRLRSGAWELQGPRVLRRAGAPWNKASPLVRAVFDAGAEAYLSGPTAAAWWGLPGFDLRGIHVSRRRGCTGTPARFAYRLHRVLDLTDEQVTELDGVPVMRPERVVFELFATEHPGKAARVAEVGWSKGLFDGRSLRRLHDELADRGRAGTVAMREWLRSRPDDWVPPASGLESRVNQILSDAGLGTWRRQVDVGADRWCGRVDFRHGFLPLVLEVQSERYHRALLDEESDARRKAALEAAGFTVVEVWDTEVWYHADVVEDRVAAALRNLQSDPA